MHSTNSLYDEENVYYDLSDKNDNVDEVLSSEDEVQEENTDSEQDAEKTENEESIQSSINIKDLSGQKHSSIAKYLTSQLKLLEFNRDVVSFVYNENLFQGIVLHKISNNKFVFLNAQTKNKKIIDVQQIA